MSQYVVDAHVHLWNTTDHDWYPALRQLAEQLGQPELYARLPRRRLPPGRRRPARDQVRPRLGRDQAARLSAGDRLGRRARRRPRPRPGHRRDGGPDACPRRRSRGPRAAGDGPRGSAAYASSTTSSRTPRPRSVVLDWLAGAGHDLRPRHPARATCGAGSRRCATTPSSPSCSSTPGGRPAPTPTPRRRGGTRSRRAPWQTPGGVQGLRARDDHDGPLRAGAAALGRAGRRGLRLGPGGLRQQHPDRAHGRSLRPAAAVARDDPVARPPARSARSSTRRNAERVYRV